MGLWHHKRGSAAEEADRLAVSAYLAEVMGEISASEETRAQAVAVETDAGDAISVRERLSDRVSAPPTAASDPSLIRSA
jgi:hypothetical protein